MGHCAKALNCTARLFTTALCLTGCWIVLQRIQESCATSESFSGLPITTFTGGKDPMAAALPPARTFGVTSSRSPVFFPISKETCGGLTSNISKILTAESTIAPLIAAGGAILLLDEPLRLHVAVGGGVILGGLALALGRSGAKR